MRRALWGVVAMLVLAPAASAHVQDPLQLAFNWPAQGTVTTPFGWTEDRYHPGLDIGMLRSLSVRAAAPGRRIVRPSCGISSKSRSYQHDM